MDIERVRVHYQDDEAIDRLCNALHPALQGHDEATVFCIGTDRSTGDALGPIIGTLLLRYKVNANVIGTLDRPVTATNIAERMHEIKDDNFIIAVDACLGQIKSIGEVTVSDGPLHPGMGLNKQLPSVGDIAIAGIVNMGGFMEYHMLQSTKLTIVLDMAAVITGALIGALGTSLAVMEHVHRDAIAQGLTVG